MFPQNRAAKQTTSNLMSAANKCLLLPWFYELLRLRGWSLEFFLMELQARSPQAEVSRKSFLGTKDCWPMTDTVSRPLLPMRLLHVVSESELAVRDRVSYRHSRFLCLAGSWPGPVSSASYCWLRH